MLFADDVCKTYESQYEGTLFNIMDHDLHQLLIWFENNGLGMNSENYDTSFVLTINLWYSSLVLPNTTGS